MFFPKGAKWSSSRFQLAKVPFQHFGIQNEGKPLSLAVVFGVLCRYSTASAQLVISQYVPLVYSTTLKKYWTMARNVINNLLIDRGRILFLPFHIKLGLIKQLTKILDKDGAWFTCPCQAFLELTMEKLKVGIFNGLQIRWLVRDPEFENSMNGVKVEAWKFSCSGRGELSWQEKKKFAELIINRLTAFRNIRRNMNIKIHYLFSYSLVSLKSKGNKRGGDSITTWKRWRLSIGDDEMQLQWLITVELQRDDH